MGVSSESHQGKPSTQRVFPVREHGLGPVQRQRVEAPLRVPTSGYDLSQGQTIAWKLHNLNTNMKFTWVHCVV